MLAGKLPGQALISFRLTYRKITVMAAREAPPGHKIINEGSASIIFGEKNEVFYNKVQILNRDLSIMAIRTFDEMRRDEVTPKQLEKRAAKQFADRGEPVPSPIPAEHLKVSEEMNKMILGGGLTLKQLGGLNIFEALSATGLRSIRYFNEIPDIQSILVNDIEPAAVEAIRKNIEFNELDTTRVIPHHGDAMDVMYTRRSPEKQFDVIDLDPYGSVAMFLDGAVQAVKNGGLLCVTCTDSAVLCGNHPEAAFARYNAVPMRTRYAHEMALRMVLGSVERAAIKYKRSIQPLLSVRVDFYVRLFIRVHDSPKRAADSSTRFSSVYQCSGCDTFMLQPLGVAGGRTGQKMGPAKGPPAGSCPDCQWRFNIGGPVWNQPLHDPAFVERIRAALDREGILGDVGRAMGNDEHFLHQKAKRKREAATTGSDATAAADESSATAAASNAPATEDTASTEASKPQKAPKARVDKQEQAARSAAIARDAGSNSRTTVLHSRARLTGLLNGIAEELLDVPFYYDIASLQSTCHSHGMSKIQMEAAIMNAGFKVSGSHTRPNVVKTDAPSKFLWDVVRTWIQSNPISDKHADKHEPFKNILAQPTEYKVDFTVPAELAEKHANRQAKFLPNPEANWGPKARAAGHAKSTPEEEDAAPAKKPCA